MVISVVFCWRSKNIKDINWLPKLIMGLASIEGIVWSSYYTINVLFNTNVPAKMTLWLNIITTITHPTIFGLLIRFQRVQVQLRAREENTIKILKSIKRANILEVVLFSSLVFSFIFKFLLLDSFEIFDNHITLAQVVKTTGNILEMAFVCILSFSFKDVNRNLALFFKQVGIRTYPKKSIALIISAFFVIVIQFDVLLIL